MKGLNWASGGQEGRGGKVTGLLHKDLMATSLACNLLGGWGWDMTLICLGSQSIYLKVFINNCYVSAIVLGAEDTVRNQKAVSFAFVFLRFLWIIFVSMFMRDTSLQSSHNAVVCFWC